MGITTDKILADVAKSLGYRRMEEHKTLRNVWIFSNHRGATFTPILVVAFDTTTGECHLSGPFEQSEVIQQFEKFFNLMFKENTLYHVADYAGFANEVMEEYESGRMTIQECYRYLHTLENPVTP